MTRATHRLATADPHDLVLDHMEMVRATAREFASRVPRHVSIDDLISAGSTGLVQAAKAWNAERGVPFEGFARQRVRGAMIDELRARDWATRRVRRDTRRVASVSDELRQELGREPDAREVAKAIGIEVAAVRRASDAARKASLLSTEALVEARGDFLPAETATPEETLLLREKQAYLTDAVELLPERLRMVVRRYYFEGCTMPQIAEELGVDKSRISQLHAEAIDLLRDGLESQLEPEMVAPPNRPGGVVARRRARYRSAVATHSTFQARLSATTQQ
jgi:RNA polymerase sigma factor for flagellar operon FliA